MKPNMRWQLLLAVTGFSLVLALLSYHVQAESRLCSERFATTGGTFVEGIVGAPRYLNPLLAGDNPVDRELTQLIFDGLTRYEQGELVPALATSWQLSEDGRTVRFELRDDATWHDGQPFTAEDVDFTYSLMQDEEFPGDASLRRLWQTVDIRVVAPNVIEFELREPYAGFLNATTIGILPAHLLADVTAEELPEVEFNHNPIGTGPFTIEPGQDWDADGLLRLKPNPAAWPQGTRLDYLAFRFLPSEEAMIEAFQQGQIQAINSVSPAMLPQVAKLPNVRLFSAPAPRYTSLLFNMGETGSVATQSIDVRRALAHGIDRELIIDETLSGQGIAHTGPYLPTSWAYHPELLTLYGSEPISATAGLEAAGWLLIDGSEMRVKDDNPLILRLLAYNTPTNRAVADELERQWQALGVAPLMSLFSDWNDYRRALNSGEFDLALVEVSPSGDPDLYDFWSQEAIVRGQNYAGWNRRRASEALEDGRRVWSQEERRPFYASFLRYYDEDLPELTLYQHVYTYAVNESVEGVAVGRIDDVRDRYRSMADWILAYKDFTVVCPGTNS